MVEFRIPEEISAFFDDEYGKMLLVKGRGHRAPVKQSLRLHLSMLKGNGAYLATRVDSETMCRQHPWIKDEIAKTRSRRGVVIGFIGADRGRGEFDYFASTHIRTMQNHVHLWCTVHQVRSTKNRDTHP